MSAVATTVEAAYPMLGSTPGAGSEVSGASPTHLQWSRDLPVAQLEPWQIRALEDVLRLAALPPNWDSYGSPPPKRNAIEASIILLVSAAPSDLPEPDVVPVSGGGIQIEWAMGRRELELNVLPSGAVEYLKAEDGEPVREDIMGVLDSIHLHSLLTWLTSGRRPE